MSHFKGVSLSLNMSQYSTSVALRVSDSLFRRVNPHEKLRRTRRVSNPSTTINPGSQKIGFLVLIKNAGFVRDNGTN